MSKDQISAASYLMYDAKRYNDRVIDVADLVRSINEYVPKLTGEPITAAEVAEIIEGI